MSVPPLPEIFGNYALGDFVEVVSPEAVSWWPQTTGWLWLGAALLTWALYRAGLLLRHWYRNRYRAEATARLRRLSRDADTVELVQQVNRLLKLTALTAFSREQVARLSGAPWPEFLNRQCPQAVFDPAQCTLLAQAAYAGSNLTEPDARQLIAASVDWVRQHKNRFDA